MFGWSLSENLFNNKFIQDQTKNLGYTLADINIADDKSCFTEKKNEVIEGKKKKKEDDYNILIWA